MLCFPPAVLGIRATDERAEKELFGIRLEHFSTEQHWRPRCPPTADLPPFLHDTTIKTKAPGWRAGPVVTALATLLEDQGLIPAPTRQLTNICNSSCRGSDALFSPWHCMHRHTGRQNTQTHKVKSKTKESLL